MKKMIFNIDNFIMNCFEKVAKLADRDNFFVAIFGAFLMIILIIIFFIPIVLLVSIYHLFIDREALMKEYEKGVKNEKIKNKKN